MSSPTACAAQYLGRLRTGWRRSPTKRTAKADVEAAAEAEMAVRRELIAMQRRSPWSTLRDQGRIGVTTLRTIEHDLDLEEARLRQPESGGTGPPRARG